MAFTDLRLETPRLILRPLEMRDFDAFAAFHADPGSMRFIGGVQSREVAWRTLMLMAGAWHLQSCSMFSMIERSSGRWIGRTGPWMPEGWPGPEVGWGVVRDCEGKGYATEAATAVNSKVRRRVSGNRPQRTRNATYSSCGTSST